jgi:hypothetical protein
VTLAGDALLLTFRGPPLRTMRATLLLLLFRFAMIKSESSMTTTADGQVLSTPTILSFTFTALKPTNSSFRSSQTIRPQ